MSFTLNDTGRLALLNVATQVSAHFVIQRHRTWDSLLSFNGGRSVYAQSTMKALYKCLSVLFVIIGIRKFVTVLLSFKQATLEPLVFPCTCCCTKASLFFPCGMGSAWRPPRRAHRPPAASCLRISENVFYKLLKTNLFCRGWAGGSLSRFLEGTPYKFFNEWMNIEDLTKIHWSVG